MNIGSDDFSQYKYTITDKIILLSIKPLVLADREIST